MCGTYFANFPTETQIYRSYVPKSIQPSLFVKFVFHKQMTNITGTVILNHCLDVHFVAQMGKQPNSFVQR